MCLAIRLLETLKQFHANCTYRLLTALVILILPNMVTANEEKAEFSLAVPPFAPFIYFNKPDKCKGILLELIDTIEKKINVKFNIERLPYPRIINNLHYKKLDSALIFKNDKLLTGRLVSENIRYIGPFAHSKILVISKRNLPIVQYNDLISLANIAVLRKASFNKKFDSDLTINKAYVGSYSQALKMMLTGRTQAVIGSQIGLEHNMLMLGMKMSDYNSFQLSDKEWGLHIRDNGFSDMQKQRLQALATQFVTPNLMYNLYQKKIALHHQCSQN